VIVNDEADVTLVADALRSVCPTDDMCEAYPDEGSCWEAHPIHAMGRRHGRIVSVEGDPDAIARVVLDALSDWLLPRGGQTRTHYAIRVDEEHPKRTERCGQLIVHLGQEKSRACREFWQGWTPMARTVTRWLDGSELYGPWKEIVDAD
jgi:hypothetical protein